MMLGAAFSGIRHGARRGGSSAKFFACRARNATATLIVQWSEANFDQRNEDHAPEIDMNAEAVHTPTPKRILLATDLSARCDRALDRAAQLARQWRVPLLVVHAMAQVTVEPWPTDDAPSWRQAPRQDAAIERQIRRDLDERIEELAIHVAEGDPAEVILDAAASDGSDLIVLGAASGQPGGGLLGNTAERLVRRSPASVLVVDSRPRGEYRHILVGTDFTAESRRGLSAAATLFPEAKLVLMHALDIPYQSLWLDPAHRQEFVRMELATIEAFIAATALPDQVRQRIQPLVEHGHPEIMLRNYVLEKDADLTVIGALNRNLAFHVLIGGTARRIVQAVPGDILVVRAPPPSSAG
jgi:nucleotide-binding universal stress UspA family protein